MTSGMESVEPFVLLDDARASGAADALLYQNPREVFVAHRAEDVAGVLAQADAERIASGGHLAGYLAYEAGLALEPKLAPLAAKRTGATGPLLWFGLFDEPEAIAAHDLPRWLAGESDPAVRATIGPLEPMISQGEYFAAFAQLQRAIRAGDIYQANLTFPLAGPYRGDPLALYAALRPAAKAGYGGIVFDGTHWLLSFSPELFVSISDGEAKVKPMKGTRPRGLSAEQDEALADELANSIKDRAENLMIVDLMRNDLSRVAQAGSVRVDKPFNVESYPTVHQMVSTVRADLEPDTSLPDLLRAIFPCGSITGAPKIRAMELINGIEPSARGPYCGAIGRVGPPPVMRAKNAPPSQTIGTAAFNVAIRTLRLTPGENAQGRAVLGVGSAIVADSQALPEWRECLVKGGFARVSSADEQAASFDLIETMRFDPEAGIELLELHLERIKASAAELGFVFDRHEARNRIQALCFDLEEAAKVRLVLARSGAIALEAGPLPSFDKKTAHCALLPLPVDESDWRLRHKSSDRGFYEDALNVVKAAGGHEAILLRDDGLITEGSFTNIFVEQDGVLLTPPASLGLLPGVLRRSLLETGKAKEAELTLADLHGKFFIGNAVRGLVRAKLLGA